ncbi:MAG: DUF4830 domain-containing protein [Ruminococcaceae bacterium]|nr:DUF4830 domain-containing protein [Oscillospiraceae bacterium]
MFVYTLRANTLKFFSVIGIALIALITLIVFVPKYETATTSTILAEKEKINFDKVKSNEDRIAFLAQYGWETSDTPSEEVTLTIPTEFDKIMKTYNELQKQQGLDLTKYKGKTVSRYTYEITNYPGVSGKVLANIVVYKNRVIGGDICSTDVNGFIHGFAAPGK